MPTVLLRLAAPMQSWGTDSVFNTRTSGTAPSKSAVVGLIASAMGRGRTDSVGDLAALKFGVRLDQPGRMVRDFQTVRDPDKDEVLHTTERHYLSDAVFLAGLEGPDDVVSGIDMALRNPVYPPFLGRRSCPPTPPLSLGVRDGCLEETLRSESWQASTWYRRILPHYVSLEAILDSDMSDNAIMVRDSPVSFDQKRRAYQFRQVRHVIDFVSVDNPDSRQKGMTDHDPIAEIRGRLRCTYHVWRSIPAGGTRSQCWPPSRTCIRL